MREQERTLIIDVAVLFPNLRFVPVFDEETGVIGFKPKIEAAQLPMAIARQKLPLHHCADRIQR